MGGTDRETDRQRLTERHTERTRNSNSNTLVYKDCSLGSVKNCLRETDRQTDRQRDRESCWSAVTVLVRDGFIHNKRAAAEPAWLTGQVLPAWTVRGWVLT